MRPAVTVTMASRSWLSFVVLQEALCCPGFGGVYSPPLGGTLVLAPLLGMRWEATQILLKSTCQRGAQG